MKCIVIGFKPFVNMYVRLENKSTFLPLIYMAKKVLLFSKRTYTSKYYTVHTDFQLIPFSHLISETVSADLVVLIEEKSYFWTEYHIIQL